MRQARLACALPPIARVRCATLHPYLLAAAVCAWAGCGDTSDAADTMLADAGVEATSDAAFGPDAGEAPVSAPGDLTEPDAGAPGVSPDATTEGLDAAAPLDAGEAPPSPLDAGFVPEPSDADAGAVGPQAPADSGSDADAAAPEPILDAGQTPVEPEQDAGSTPEDAGQAPEPTTDAWWQPPIDTSWDLQLATPVDYTPDYGMYMVDPDDHSAEDLHAIKTRGGAYQDEPAKHRRVVCLVNVGVWEGYRADADAFPLSVRGDEYDGDSDQRWLDIRQLDVLRPLMQARFERAQAKGCDAVQPENMDVYNDTAHDPTGFDIGYQHQLDYNRWVAEAVHTLGMAVGLSNDGHQANDLVDVFDFAVTQECVRYDECRYFEAFVAAGKAVFLVEFLPTTAEFCPVAAVHGFVGIRKNDALDAYREACTP